MEKLQQFELKHRSDLSSIKVDFQALASTASTKSIPITATSNQNVEALKTHLLSKIAVTETNTSAMLDDLAKRICRLEGSMDHSFIDSSSKSLFINTTKEPSLAGIGFKTQKSTKSKNTHFKSTHFNRSVDEETNVQSKSLADLKMVMDLKNDIREKFATFEHRFATKDEITEAVDKLGEEIAFDIN